MPETLDGNWRIPDERRKRVAMKGTVVYVHPQNRFARVAFDCWNGKKIIESFHLDKVQFI